MRKFLALVLTLAIVSLAAGAAWAAPPERVRVLIGFKGATDAELVKGHGGRIDYVFDFIPVISAEIPVTARDALAHNPNVAYVEDDGIAYALGEVVTVAAEPAATTQSVPWGITKIGADQVWSTTTGAGVKVAILDTGIDLDHPDLQVYGGTNFVTPGASYDDDNGHGTHCAGIVAALNNTLGVVGVAPGANLYAVKVLDSGGSGSYTGIAQGIEWAVANGMKVISMSLGGSQTSDTLQLACDTAYANGVVVVAAAGNEGKKNTSRDNVSYPAKYESVIAVAATDIDDVRASFSSTGPAVEVAAPGVSIYSTYFDGSYTTMSGTSMACPHVAGLAALVIAAHPTWTNVEVREAIDMTCVDLGTVGRDWVYGYGRVWAPGAVSYIH